MPFVISIVILLCLIVFIWFLVELVIDIRELSHLHSRIDMYVKGAKKNVQITH